MNEQTRPVRVYFHAEGPPRPAFGEDIDKADAENYSYCGWLPLALTPPSEPDGEHVTAILGDNWLTIPREAIQRPNAGAAGYPISAADCHTEIEARAKCNLAYFLKETPDETGEPYDRRQIATEDQGDAADAARQPQKRRKHTERARRQRRHHRPDQRPMHPRAHRRQTHDDTERPTRDPTGRGVRPRVPGRASRVHQAAHRRDPPASPEDDPRSPPLRRLRRLNTERHHPNTRNTEVSHPSLKEGA